LALAREGAAISLCGRNQEPLEKAAGELAELRVQVMVTACDVSREDEVIHLVEAAAERMGGLTILVTNAEQVLLLASPAGDSTTGQVFTIDRGFGLQRLRE
jgi:NAD(P)-dependent dehydrogenase (short-subunit alcohol dehydrogenase family)